VLYCVSITVSEFWCTLAVALQILHLQNFLASVRRFMLVIVDVL